VGALEVVGGWNFALAVIEPNVRGGLDGRHFVIQRAIGEDTRFDFRAPARCPLEVLS
jgi:hypothetical protein